MIMEGRNNSEFSSGSMIMEGRNSWEFTSGSRTSVHAETDRALEMAQAHTHWHTPSNKVIPPIPDNCTNYSNIGAMGAFDIQHITK